MNRCILLIAVIALIVGCGAQSFADTDYRCLNVCVNSGKTSNACLKECAYGKIDANDITSSTAKPVGSSDQFATPVPTDGKIVLPDAAVVEKPIDIDYVCLAKCQKEGLQYQLCSKRCDKEELHKKAIDPALISPR